MVCPPGACLLLVSFLFLIFLYLNAESPRPLGTASPNFQGSRMGGWNRPSLSPIFKFLSWRGAGVEKVPKNVWNFCWTSPEIFRVGVAQFIVNIFSPVRKVEKTGVLLRPVSPAASNRAGYSAPFWLGVTISRESSTFLDLVDLRLLAGFSMGGPDAPPP